MIIKICGITTVEAALAAAENGANWIGFLFAPSKRNITPEKAARIAKEIPSDIKKVGVFVNEMKENIETIARTVGLDYIQLHGDESAEFAASLPYPVIKAFSIDQLEKIETPSEYPCDFMLVDSPGTTHRGGSGNVFSWDRLLARKLDHRKLILAGGLHANNVSEAIQSVRPAGVDVSSGVETDGKKDLKKIAAFIHAVRNG